MSVENFGRVRIPDIQSAVCEEFGVAPIEMISRRRYRRVARPRQVAMYLSRELTLNSLPEIGRRFGGRDHTTVMHALDVIERLLKDDVEIKYHVDQIRQRLAGAE